MMFGCWLPESIMLELFLDELPNINHFISQSILTKSISTKLIISRINYTKAEPNTHLMTK